MDSVMIMRRERIGAASYIIKFLDGRGRIPLDRES